MAKLDESVSSGACVQMGIHTYTHIGDSDGEKSQGLTQISYIRSPANPGCMLLLEIREESVCLFAEY